jgi:hypothetical protein
VTALTTRQVLSRPDMLAMTTAVHRWATYGVLPVGALASGLAASFCGPRLAIVLAASTAQLSILAPTECAPLRRLQTLNPPA